MYFLKTLITVLYFLKSTQGKTLVVYAYSEHTLEAIQNLEFFLQHGLIDRSDLVDYVFVVNGCHSVAFPDGVQVIERENSCFDFGAWKVGLEGRYTQYTEFILLNGSVRGPFLPLYEKRYWFQVLTDLAQDGSLVGTTINCMDLNSTHFGLLHLQSMALAFNLEALQHLIWPLLTSGCPIDKASAIYDYELPLSRIALSQGRSLIPLSFPFLQLKKIAMDTTNRNKLATICNRLRINSALQLGDVYYPAAHAIAADVHPLDVIFFKTTDRTLANRPALHRLSQWNSPSFLDDDLYVDSKTANRRQSRVFQLNVPRGLGECSHHQNLMHEEDTSDLDINSENMRTQRRLAEVETALQNANSEIKRLREALVLAHHSMR